MFLFFLSLCFYMRTLDFIYIGLPHLCLLQEKHTTKPSTQNAEMHMQATCINV